ncbi:MAG: hypothetical protein WCX65_01350 [bacterium]
MITKLLGIIFYLILLSLLVYGAITRLGKFRGFLSNSQEVISGRSNKFYLQCARLGRKIARLFVLIAKAADSRLRSPEDEKSILFRIALFIVFAAVRVALIMPIILYAHFPSVFPNLSIYPKPAVVLFGVFCIVVFVFRSLLDVVYLPRRRERVSLFLYYCIGAYALVLWYPMFYIVHFMFRWFFPALLAVAAPAMFFALKTKRAAISAALQILIIPSCIAFVPAMEVFTFFQQCKTVESNPAMEYYLNYCDESRQLISPATMNSSLSEKQRNTIRKKHREAFQIEDRVFIGASIEDSFAYDFADKSIMQIKPDKGMFSIVRDAPSGRIFVASPQDKMLNVYDSSSLALIDSISYGESGGPYWLEADEATRRLFVGFGETRSYRAIIYDMDDMKILKLESLHDRMGGALGETAFCPRRGMVYVLDLFNENYVGAYDLDELRLKRERKLPWFTLGMNYSNKLDSLFLTTPLSSFGFSEVIELDPDTLATRGRMNVPIGAKDIAVGADGFVYVSNYLTGDIYKIDWSKRRISDSIQAGRKIKRMEYSPELNLLMFTSERGYARIDLGKWRQPQHQN